MKALLKEIERTVERLGWYEDGEDKKLAHAYLAGLVRAAILLQEKKP